jgi:hypothetical protein
MSTLVVSPVNARQQLAAFIKAARKELIIYDPEVSDPGMIRILEERASAGVRVRIIGKVTKRNHRLSVRKLGHMRLHTRTIVRDGDHAFIGSQSLREMELEKRRELGLLFRDRKAVKRLIATFEEDWNLSEKYAAGELAAPMDKVAKKVAKAFAKDLPPIGPVLEGVARQAGDISIDRKKIEETVKEAVKEAVEEAVRDVVEKVGASDLH